ncbi:MAG: type III pantothenate kinase [Clostridia bacterium]|nr:type III pantothenate kinase [Clostridia bacterium]
MILAIDIGNTNIVVGGICREKIYFVSRISTDRSKTEDEYAITLKSIMNMYDVSSESINGAIISSVVPPLSNILKAAVKKITGKTPLLVGPGIKTGLNILIDNPGQLGSDLVVDSVAAIAQYPKPIIIFDMGTATTISIIDKNGSYIGGIIFPGIMVSQEALSGRTSQLPHISPETPADIIGKNTIDAMKSGLINGNASFIDGMIDRIEEKLREKASVVATGGLSGFIIPHCKRNIIHDENLLLKGLWLIHEKNAK